MRGRQGVLKVVWSTAFSLVAVWAPPGFAQGELTGGSERPAVTEAVVAPEVKPENDTPAAVAAEFASEGPASGRPDERSPGDPDLSSASEDVAARCESDHERAQVERLSGRLLAAREALVSCARESCPSFFRSDCARWLDEVRAEIPTVVFEALGTEGALVDVTVSVDGRVVAQRLDGRPMAFEPGLMEATFSAPSGETKVVRVVLRQGEKNRVVSVTFEPTRAAPLHPSQPEEDEPIYRSVRPVPTAVYVLGGVAATATLATVTFGILAKVREGEAQAHCAPQCTESVVNRVQALALSADISLGIALASGATALVLYLTRPTIQLAQTSLRNPVAFLGPDWPMPRVAILAEGALVSLGGSF